MTRIDAQTMKALAHVARQYPEVVAFFENWRQNELSALPMKLNNTALFQGRCQVLSEVAQLLKEAPDNASKL